MEYHISEQENNLIQAELPQGFTFSFVRKDGRYVHTTELLNKWPSVDMDSICNSLFQKSYTDFLAEKYTAMMSDPIYKAELIRDIYAPIGQQVVSWFMGRNSVDGINNAQSKHVVQKAGEITTFLNSGAIPDALAALATLTPDDMTESYHWLSQERIDLVLNDINTLLGEL